MLYMFLADGFEEVEAIATLDVIRRAKIDIETVGVGSKNITGAHGVTVRCDIDTDEATFTGLDGVILPGGMPGTKNLLADDHVNKAIDFCYSQGKLVSAICAAPMILGVKGLLKGKEATCFPGFEGDLEGAIISEKYYVTDGNIITARGMGSAINFGLEIVKYFKDEATANELKATLQYS
ncbi:MAG: DJ-1/PfpI family protein [Clostridia bacterium]|nr:DJ-1/PfpI family protein [Clostridia bacterium]